MLNKAKKAAEKYTGHGDSHKDESTLHHMKHEAEKMYLKHAARDYAEDHGFLKKKHHEDESILDKAKDAVSKMTGLGESQKKKEDESFLDKAMDVVEKYTGHGDSHTKKDDESFLDKAKEAVGQYTHKH